MQKENDRVPPLWGDDMEEALMAQGEVIRGKTTSVRCRRWLSWCRSTTLCGLGLIIAIILIWFLLAFAMVTRTRPGSGLSETPRIDLPDRGLRC
jgi:hypothetical protein